jgi:hypothetical protein
VKVIWNYTVPFNVLAPKDRVILCHDKVLPVIEYAWDDAIRFWTEHEQGGGDFTGEETHNWSFTIVSTGKDIPDGYEYVGTTTRNVDGNIWHLYRMRV